MTEGDKPSITITDKDGKATTYTPSFETESYSSTIVFKGPNDDTAPISTSSDPCSA